MQIIDRKSARLVGALLLFGAIDLLIYKFFGPFSVFINILSMMGMGLQFYLAANYSDYAQNTSIDFNTNWLNRFRSKESILNREMQEIKNQKNMLTNTLLMGVVEGSLTKEQLNTRMEMVDSVVAAKINDLVSGVYEGNLIAAPKTDGEIQLDEIQLSKEDTRHSDIDGIPLSNSIKLLHTNNY